MVSSKTFLTKINVLNVFFCLSLLTAGVIVNGLGILSPAYFSIVFVVLFLILFANIAKSRYLLENQIFVICAAWFFLELFINPTGDKKTGLFLIVTMLSYPVFDLFCKKLNSEKLLQYSVCYIRFVIFLYLFELGVRLISNNFTFQSLTNPMFFVRMFYLYKENLIIGGGDTNFIATHLLITFFFLFYLKRRFLLKMRLESLLLIFLIFFTFSRASWISLFVGIVTIMFIHKKGKTKIIKIRLLFIFSLVFVLLIFLFSALAYDPSFQTKIEIWNITTDFINNAKPRDLLLGLGFLNSIQIVEFNVAHTLISTLLMDTGLVSLILYFLCWIPILKQSRGFALYILIPIFIFALSFIQQMIPYLYITLAIISNLEERNAFCNNSSL